MDASKEGRYWMKFFLEAGIPSNIGADYTVKFIDHRIQKSILEDLSRDVLLEMGIKAMGDVIAILKHAKRVSLEVDRQSLRKSKRHDEDDDDVIMEEYSEPVAVVAAPRRTKSTMKEKAKKKVITVKPTTTTTKTKTIKKQTAKPKQIHDDDDDDVTMMKRISAIRQETMTSPSQKSVFTRLGSDVTGDTEQLNTSSDVFRRLGDLQPSVTSTTCDDVTMMDVDDDVTSTVQTTQQQQRKKATVVKRKNFAPSSGILSRLGDAKIEVSVGKNSNEKRVISSSGSSREPMVIRLPLVNSRDHPVVSSTSDSPPKRYTSMHSDHLDDNQHRPVVAKKRSIGGGSASSGVLRLKKKRTSAPSSLGMATVKSSAGSTVFNRLGTHKSPSSKMPTTTKPVVKTTKMAAGKRVSMATMDQIVTSSTSSSVRSRLGASPKIVKKSSSMTNLGGGASDKSRISKLLQSSGGRVRIKKSSMTKSSSLSAGVLKRGGGGASSSGNSVFDRLGGR